MGSVTSVYYKGLYADIKRTVYGFCDVGIQQRPVRRDKENCSRGSVTLIYKNGLYAEIQRTVHVPVSL